jgi:Arylsulfotransferase (ASST)
MGRSGSRLLVVAAVLAAICGLQAPARAATPDYSQSSVVASDNIATEITKSGIKVYLNTFRPNMDLFLNIGLKVSGQYSSTDKSILSVSNTNGVLQYHMHFGAFLTASAKTTPLATIRDQSGIARIQVFGMPADFPLLSIQGNASTISGLSFLATPTTSQGAYAIATQGTNIRFFVKSPRFIVGFRELKDSTPMPLASGTPRYAYLEQYQLNHESLSPGIWRFLNENFEVIGRVNTFTAYNQELQGDGHDLTVGPDGNPVVIAVPTRTVDSSWLAKPYTGAIADCIVAEVFNGKALHTFSLWDWANSHRDAFKSLLDAGLRDPDPSQPTGPSDICHANSIQYNQGTKEYLVSVRSLSALLILDSTLSTVKGVLSSPGSMQHFARFDSPTQITALGNYTNEKFSRLQTWKLVNGQWVLSEIALPIHVQYCGNAQMIDKSHLWVGGGCQAFEKNVLGILYDLSGSAPVELSRLVASSMGYSYRADLYKP